MSMIEVKAFFVLVVLFGTAPFVWITAQKAWIEKTIFGLGKDQFPFPKRFSRYVFGLYLTFALIVGWIFAILAALLIRWDIIPRP